MINWLWKYKSRKQIKLKTIKLHSDLSNFFDVHIVVKKVFPFLRPDNNAYDKKLAPKNNALITKD